MARKRIVLCLDGTWNNPYQKRMRDDGSVVLKPTNTLKLARAVLPWDGVTAQITYYDTGVGALGTYPGRANRIVGFVDKKLGGAYGAGFEANIEQALTFLVNNYRDGDHVCIFGFSRGAAQARGLTRFIDWLGGIPEKIDAYFVPLFFHAYLSSRGTSDAADVKTARGQAPEAPMVPIEIDMLGVWDTVMALGSRFETKGGTSTAERSFHVGLRPARCVRNARQALAIDEKRYDFRPEIWHAAHEHQTLEQRWFAGVHSNVGGGYARDGLANLAFHWILDESAHVGLATDPDYVRHFKGYHAAAQYDSGSWLYTMLELLRFRRGKGKRAIVDQPPEAHLELHKSVIHRINETPGGRHPQLEEAYRPENVIAWLATKDDRPEYLASLGLKPEQRELPEDVRGAIDAARRA